MQWKAIFSTLDWEADIKRAKVRLTPGQPNEGRKLVLALSQPLARKVQGQPTTSHLDGDV